jgi:integrase
MEKQMIQEYKKNGKTYFKIRIFTRSTQNSNLRITKQAGGFTSLSEAKKEETRLRKECERELHQNEARGILWGDLLNLWYDHTFKIKVQTGKLLKINLDDYIASLNKWFGKFHNRPAVEINPYVLMEVFEKMKTEKISFRHRKKVKFLIKAIFDYGIQSGLVKGIHKSPTFDVVLAKDTAPKEPEILKLQDIQKLIKRAYEEDHQWRRVWATALLTGMRSGELFALTWKDIDFENRLIYITKSYNNRLNLTKSTKGGYWRQSPISEDLEKVLREQFEETRKCEHVFPRLPYWERGSQAKILRAFCYINGIPSIKFHTLRACFATQMLRLGVAPAKVMKICGWKDLKTMQHYIRLAGIDIQGVTDAIDIMGQSKSPQERNLPSYIPDIK